MANRPEIDFLNFLPFADFITSIIFFHDKNTIEVIKSSKIGDLKDLASLGPIFYEQTASTYSIFNLNLLLSRGP